MGENIYNVVIKMDNLKDLFININDFNVDDIVYVKPILFYKVCKTMGVYYKKPIEPIEPIEPCGRPSIPYKSDTDSEDIRKKKKSKATYESERPPKPYKSDSDSEDIPKKKKSKATYES